MRLVGSSQPGAVERDRAEALLYQRLVLTDAVCRALEATDRDDFLDRRAGEALGLLRGWVGTRYERDVETHPRDGLAGMMVPPGCEDLMTELRAGTEVCEAYAMLRTADNDSELKQDAARVRQELGAWEQVHRRLAGDVVDEPDDDFPAYAVHAPVRTMLVRPGGAVGHRASYDLPGPVHVIAASSSTGALLGSTGADTDRLAGELHRRGHQLWWAFDPDDPSRESLFVRGLSDDDAREFGRDFRQHLVTRWDQRAWRELDCHDSGATSEHGWRFGPFRGADVAGGVLSLDIVRPDGLVERHLVVGVPGRWTVCSRSGRGDGRGPQVRHVDAETLLDAVAADPELVTLHRREFRRYEVSGDVGTAELIDRLVVVPTEGSEDPAEWPARFATDHDLDPTPRFDQPWIERWATVNGCRVSALYADGRTVVVPLDGDHGDLAVMVEDLRRGPRP